jgi:hypothetical protein
MTQQVWIKEDKVRKKDSKNKETYQVLTSEVRMETKPIGLTGNPFSVVRGIHM